LIKFDFYFKLELKSLEYFFGLAVKSRVVVNKEQITRSGFMSWDTRDLVIRSNYELVRTGTWNCFV